jgi:tetratricopeptide (TPR) repeat protein
MQRHACLAMLVILAFSTSVIPSAEPDHERLELRLEKYLQRLAEAQSDRDRFYPLNEIAKLSFELGDHKRAERFARKALAAAKDYPDDWNYGNAIHDGHMVLGRIALARGNRIEARDHLLLAGQTRGSPQLGSFGPNVSLARDLLEIGERETVLEYFRLCRIFWKSEIRPLDGWIATVEQGGQPDFGANLSF